MSKEKRKYLQACFDAERKQSNALAEMINIHEEHIKHLEEEVIPELEEKAKPRIEEVEGVGLYKRIYPSVVTPVHSGLVHLISSKGIFKEMYSGDGHYRNGRWEIWYSTEGCYVPCTTPPDYWMEILNDEEPVEIK